MPKYFPVTGDNNSYKTWLSNHVDRFANIPLDDGGNEVFNADTSDRTIGQELCQDFLALLQDGNLDITQDADLETPDTKKGKVLKLMAVLEGKPEDPSKVSVFNAPEGDVAAAKDLVGGLLATLTGEPVTIN